MPPISIMLKPASSLCNMRCKYCFYHSLAENRTVPAHDIMTEATLTDILQKAFAFANGASVMISFQGGEPLLAGKDFFKRVHYLIVTLNLKKSPVFLGLQTNGTLIDEEWCEIFRRGHYLIGLSLDGDAAANSLRIDANGNPTFQKVYASAKLMQKSKVNFNILVVLTKQISERITTIYTFFRKNNFKHLQFIPCLRPLTLDENGKAVNAPSYGCGGEANPADNKITEADKTATTDKITTNDLSQADGSAKNEISNGVNGALSSNANADCATENVAEVEAQDTEEEVDFYLNTKDYENFLIKCFTLYTKDYIDGRYTSIRMFDNFVKLANSQRAEQCGMNGHCCHQFVIESNGETYPCDFYCLDAYSLGNILELDFTAMSKNPIAVKFIEESLEIDEKCKNCTYYRLCRNGCKRERIDIDKCDAFKAFFPYALPHLKKMS
ncbi:MAG: radical SAM protein [Clostridia bacterium]